MIGLLKNEALALLAIQAVLEKNSNINIANSYLIVPLLLDRKLRNYLKRKSTKVYSLQDLVAGKNEMFIGFNEKYIDSLIVSTNAISMGIELNIFKIQDSSLVMVEKSDLGKENENLGKKVDDILKASGNVSKILSESPESTYSLLRITI